MYHCFRLKKGNDLKKELESFAIKNNISGVILCCVGCLDNLNIRLADAKDYLIEERPFEIVSATGTLSKDGVHIHISVSDVDGNTLGGHLMEGCIINTTAEVCILELEQFEFGRKFDEDTGYKELTIQGKKERGNI